MAEVISNVGNRYIFGKESEYGTIPGSITALDLGHVQTISISEDEGTSEITSMNSGHTPIDFEDSVYNLSGTIVTLGTKASIPVILEALCGSLTDNSDDTYTIATSAITSSTLSYYMKVNTTSGKTKQLKGICITGGELNIEKDGSCEFTLNFQAQIMSAATESLSPSTNTGAIFKGLDATITFNSVDTILNNFTLSMDWNFDIGDSRGIEEAHANGRRVINRIIRNNLTLNGNFESHMDDTIDAGYSGERTSVDLVLTLSRGTSNEHVFTISNTRTSNRSRELTNENGAKVINCDFVGTDLAVTGDY